MNKEAYFRCVFIFHKKKLLEYFEFAQHSDLRQKWIKQINERPVLLPSPWTNDTGDFRPSGSIPPEAAGQGDGTIIPMKKLSRKAHFSNFIP